MEYALSHTFGKGGLIFPNSLTLNLQSGVQGNKSKNKNKNVYQKCQRYSIIPQSDYPSNVNQDNNQTQFYREKQQQLKNHRPFLWVAKANQIHQKERKAEIEEKIKNVDGINQRMANLIRQFRQSQEKYDKKVYDKPNQIVTIQKSQSSKQLKHSYNNFQSNQLNDNKAKNKKYDNYSKWNESQRQSLRQKTVQNIKKYQQRFDMQTKHTKKQKFAINNSSYKKSGQLSSDYEKGLGQSVNKINLRKQQIQANHESNCNRKTNRKNPTQNTNYELKYNIGQHKNRNPSVLLNSRQKQIQQKYLVIKNKNETERLKSKAKIVQSQIQNYKQNDEDILSEINKISFVEESDDDIDLCIKLEHKDQQEEQTIYLGLFDQNQQKNLDTKCHEYGLSNKIEEQRKPKNHINISNLNNQNLQSTHVSRHSKTNSESFENGLGNITQKIESYQKKVENLSLNRKRQDRFQRRQDILGKKQKNDFVIESDVNKCFTKNEKQKEVEIKGLHTKQNKENEENKDNKHKRKLTPTWGWNGQNRVLYEFWQQFDSNYMKHFTQNQKGSDTIKMAKKTNKKIVLSIKFGFLEIAQKLSKQIQLDSRFRKQKKQLSKFPEQSNPSKWYDLKKYFIQLTENQHLFWSIQEIFTLSDEEADPFLSISKQDLKNYQDVIRESMQSFITTQVYFYQNILHQFPKDKVQEIFKREDGNDERIKLDQFTAMVSNTTKINYKCRDLYLLYQRIMKYAQQKEGKNAKIYQGINLKKLIEALSVSDEQVNSQFDKVGDNFEQAKDKKLIKQPSQKDIKIEKVGNETLKFERKNCNIENDIRNKSWNQLFVLKGKSS